MGLLLLIWANIFLMDRLPIVLVLVILSKQHFKPLRYTSSCTTPKLTNSNFQITMNKFYNIDFVLKQYVFCFFPLVSCITWPIYRIISVCKIYKRHPDFTLVSFNFFQLHYFFDKRSLTLCNAHTSHETVLIPIHFHITLSIQYF